MRTFLIIVSIVFWTAMDIYLWSEKFIAAGILIAIGILLFNWFVKISEKALSRKDKFRLSEWQIQLRKIGWANGRMIILLVAGAALEGIIKVFLNN